MSRYRKAFGGLWVIIVVLVLVIVSARILGMTIVITKKVHLQGKIDIYLDLDDKGTGALSFLSSTAGERDYMEILGSMTAMNAKDNLRTELNKLGNTLQNLKKNYYIVVRDASGNKIFERKKGSSTNLKVYKLGSIRLDWPVRGSITISSGFGYRTINGRPDFHGGIDIASPEGTEVYPAAEGVVVRIGRGCTRAPGRCEVVSESPKKYNYKECGCGSGLGNYVVIKHHEGGKTFYTFYVHLNGVAPNLKEGDRVTPATLIGFVGSTGYSLGPHLHFEVGTKEKKSDTTAVDPCPYLPNAPLECEQPSHRTKGYEIDIPLPGGNKGKVEMVIW